MTDYLLTWVAKCLMIQIYADGKTTMHVHEKRASLRQFYGEKLEMCKFVLELGVRNSWSVWVYVNRCCISFDYATPKWDHGFGGEETEGDFVEEILTNGRVGQWKALGCRCRKRSRMRDLHGNKWQSSVAQLYSLTMLEVLSWLVRFILLFS